MLAKSFGHSQRIRGPRLCHLCKRSDFTGYGFNLVCHKGNWNRQLISNIDANSPAEEAGLENDDIVIEVNGLCVRDQSHQHVVNLIMKGFVDVRTGKQITDQVLLLVVDPATEAYYRINNVPVKSEAACYGQQRCSTSICVVLETTKTKETDDVIEFLNQRMSVEQVRKWISKHRSGKRDPRRDRAIKLTNEEKLDLVHNM